VETPAADQTAAPPIASVQREPDRCRRNFPAVTPYGRWRGGRSVTQAAHCGRRGQLAQISTARV
jgi:hypothetical protein